MIATIGMTICYGGLLMAFPVLCGAFRGWVQRDEEKRYGQW